MIKRITILHKYTRPIRKIVRVRDFYREGKDTKQKTEDYHSGLLVLKHQSY